MTEVQHLEWQPDGSFTIKSTPSVGIMMGSNYVTSTCLTVSSSQNQPSTTCQVCPHRSCVKHGGSDRLWIYHLFAREAGAIRRCWLRQCCARSA